MGLPSMLKFCGFWNEDQCDRYCLTMITVAGLCMHMYTPPTVFCICSAFFLGPNRLLHILVDTSIGHETVDSEENVNVCPYESRSIT